MSFEHGVKIEETPTAIVPPARLTAGLTVYVGTAPINMGDPTAVDKPVLINNEADGANILGYKDGLDWSKWTLLEAIKAHFVTYRVGPIVCINVLDPKNSDHIVDVSAETKALDSKGKATLAHEGLLPATLVVKVGITTMALGTDYTIAFDDDGKLVVTRVSTGAIPALATLTVYYTYLDPTAIDADAIIGGFSAGKYTGIQAIEQVYPRLKLVPGFAAAPKWSEDPTVAAALEAAAREINGSFRAMALVDLSTDEYAIASAADAPSWKSDNGFNTVNEIVGWPKVKNGDDEYHLSTVIACVANLTDNDHGGVPYASPSNKAIVGTSAVLDDDSEVLLTKPEANALNAQGIVTVLNGFNGWKLWGNRTGGYPGTTDPKDAFIPIRRMFNWAENTIIVTTDVMVDEPGNKRLIERVVNTVQIFFNGLVAQGALVAGEIKFLADDNPITDLADGKIVFDVSLTPPSPGESLKFKTSYDPTKLAALFA